MINANVNLRIDRRGLDFIESWELYVGYVYDDKVPMRKGKYPEYKGGPVRGTLTIGIGHTKAAKCVVDMSVGAKMTHAEAKRVLDVDLDPCEAFVRRVVNVPLTQGQFNALVSFVFNCGEGAFSKSSILRKLNREDYQGARAAFDLYVYSKGEKMRGLQRRRDAEQVLWDEGEDLANFMPEEGEAVEHPAEVDEPNGKSVVKSTEAMTSAGQVVGGVAGDVHEVGKAIDAHEVVEKALDAKSTAEQFGVEPLDLYHQFSGPINHLVHSPVFWACTAMIGVGTYLFLRRRWRLKEEV